MDSDGVTLVAPENPLVVEAGETGMTGAFLTVPTAAFSAGEIAITLRIIDGVDFSRDIPYRLLGPAGCNRWWIVKKGAVWPYLIAGALALHVVVSLIVVFIATSDASYAVEEDYYQKAIDWDQKRAQDRTNETLGWLFDFEVAPPEKPGDQPMLEVTLRDEAGDPLTGATVTVETFHNSRSDDILRAALIEIDEPGVYRTTLPMRHNGRWEMRFTAVRNDDRLTHSETRHLVVKGNWQ